MHALDALRCAPEIKVDAPERGAEGIREAGCALIVERVRLAEDKGDGVVSEEGADVGLVCD